MVNVFDGFRSSASWLEEFISSQAADETKKDAVASWEDDVITAVKKRIYTSVDDAMKDLRSRTGLTETAMVNIKKGIIKRTATDKEWHALFGTTTPELTKLAQLKNELVTLANEFDAHGDLAISDAIDEALDYI